MTGSTTFATAAGATAMAGGDGEGYSIAAAWQPADSGWMPSISTGYSSFDPEASSEEVEGWYVGFEWSDVLIDGNSLGYAIGSMPNTGSSDDNTIWELFYSMAVSDNITVTPAIFGSDFDGTNPDAFGGLVKTTFKF